VQEEQFAWQRDKDARERAIRESIAAQLKLYENMLHEQTPKFPSGFADIPMTLILVFTWRNYCRYGSALNILHVHAGGDYSWLVGCHCWAQ